MSTVEAGPGRTEDGGVVAAAQTGAKLGRECR
jgi:hypothetical protein